MVGAFAALYSIFHTHGLDRVELRELPA